MDKQQIDRILRGVAGLFTIISALLTIWHSIYWTGFTLLIGINLLQSYFTNWCPLISILKKFFPEKK